MLIKGSRSFSYLLWAGHTKTCLHGVGFASSGVQVELLDVGEEQLDWSHLELVGAQEGDGQLHALHILCEDAAFVDGRIVQEQGGEVSPAAVLGI